VSVLFFTEGGGSYGLGHISRTKSIAEALEEEWIKSAFFCDAPEDIDLGGSSIRRFAWFKDEERLKAEIAAFNAPIEAVVVDSYQAGIKTLRCLASLRVPILYLDDYHRLDYPKGIIVNPANLKYPDIFGSRVFTGAEFAPLRSAFWDTERLELSDREYTLITLGGVKDYKIFCPLVRAVRESVSGEVTALGGVNNDDGSFNKVDGVKYISPPLDMYDMRELTRRARVVVCGGGVTLAEAARVGTPAVTVSLAQNQTENIKMFCMAGCAVFAGDAASDTLTASVSKKLNLLNDDDFWERFSLRGPKLVDGQGARRIAKILMLEIDGVFYYDELRKDHEIDGVYLTHFTNCSGAEQELILEARNSEAVLSTVYNQHKITRAAHLEFIKSLESSTTSGYWLASEGERYIGVFSLTDIDRFNSECEVGYYKLPTAQRKGVGVALLTLAAEIAFGGLNLSSVTAESFGENIASIKSLERAGFLFEEEKEKIVLEERKRIRKYRLKRS
jgi:UDP-4-amino-4,6-dideoxy-N-acetyl-beta-L-altrosamine N-acetyltransferase